MSLKKTARPARQAKVASPAGRNRSEKRSVARHGAAQEAAYKIASEAVACTVLGMGTVDWVAVPAEGVAGRLQVKWWSRILRLRLNKNDAMAEANSITVLLSGLVALRYRGQGPGKGLGDRSDIVLQLAAAACGEYREAKAFVDWLYLRSANVVRHNWSAIESVAHALMTKGVLSGREVRRLILHAQQSTELRASDRVRGAAA